jgi:hypothetical protein
MSTKPNPSVLPWDHDSLSILRQVFRVAIDESFRNGSKGGEPSALEIARKYNLSTDDDWKTFVLDLPVGGKVYKDLEFDTEYARDLIGFLVKRFQLPIRKEWHRKSFMQRWEMRRHQAKGGTSGSP